MADFSDLIHCTCRECEFAIVGTDRNVVKKQVEDHEVSCHPIFAHQRIDALEEEVQKLKEQVRECMRHHVRAR